MYTEEIEEVVIDDEIMEELRDSSRDTGRTLEETIDRYIDFVTGGHQKLAKNLPADLASLRGKYRAPAGFDRKEALSEELHQKYTG